MKRGRTVRLRTRAPCYAAGWAGLRWMVSFHHEIAVDDAVTASRLPRVALAIDHRNAERDA